MTMVNFAAPVQALIPQVEARMRSQSNGYHEELRLALEHLLSAGGKRVRPTVALLVSAMLGVEQSRAITLAAAVELLHTATLVHDDLIDGALLRRGNPTLNSQWNTSATILAGDFLFSQAASLGAEVDSIPVMQMFAKALSTIVNGEIGQIFGRGRPAKRADYYARIYAKTASMFELAARAPAYLVEDGEPYGEDLLVYGYEIGMAFQIVDDVLDFSSDATTVGKPVANDLRQGLVTLPVYYYAELEPEDASLRTVLAGESLAVTELDALIERMRGSEAMQLALEEAEGHSAKALATLETLPDCPERQALADLTEYVVERLR
jgi:geranylgeranyl pyrophosphate synthase